MKYWVGVTDDSWFHFLAERNADEVNFWRPGAQANWSPIPPGAPFLFKLHSPENYIVGGGYFLKHTVLPISLAWLAYEKNNGTNTIEALREAINRYRTQHHETMPHDPAIGCTLLTQPFYWPKNQWIPVPSQWPMNVVQGKTLDTEDEIMGQKLWQQVEQRLGKTSGKLLASGTESVVMENHERFGSPQIIRPRLGQGAFRVLVTDAYQRRCAITGEKTLPVLEAAHIKPFSEKGPHEVQNGLLLRSDLHILFDRGYLGVDQDLKIHVSSKIREEFENGRDYYVYQGQRLKIVPQETEDRPLPDYLKWQLKERFLA